MSFKVIWFTKDGRKETHVMFDSAGACWRWVNMCLVGNDYATGAIMVEKV